MVHLKKYIQHISYEITCISNTCIWYDATLNILLSKAQWSLNILFFTLLWHLALPNLRIYTVMTTSLYGCQTSEVMRLKYCRYGVKHHTPNQSLIEIPYEE